MENVAEFYQRLPNGAVPGARTNDCYCVPGGPTKRQLFLYGMIKDFIEENGHPPTLRELRKKLQIHINGIRNMLMSLERGDLISYKESDDKSAGARSIKINGSRLIVQYEKGCEGEWGAYMYKLYKEMLKEYGDK